MPKKSEKQKLLEGLIEKLHQLNRNQTNYIIHVILELKRGNDKYRNRTKEEILKDFDDWKTNQKPQEFYESLQVISV